MVLLRDSYGMSILRLHLHILMHNLHGSNNNGHQFKLWCHNLVSRYLHLMKVMKVMKGQRHGDLYGSEMTSVDSSLVIVIKCSIKYNKIKEYGKKNTAA
jgi:hypothetical protein